MVFLRTLVLLTASSLPPFASSCPTNFKKNTKKNWTRNWKEALKQNSSQNGPLNTMNKLSFFRGSKEFERKRSNKQHYYLIEIKKSWLKCNKWLNFSETEKEAAKSQRGLFLFSQLFSRIFSIISVQMFLLLLLVQSSSNAILRYWKPEKEPLRKDAEKRKQSYGQQDPANFRYVAGKRGGVVFGKNKRTSLGTMDNPVHREAQDPKLQPQLQFHLSHETSQVCRWGVWGERLRFFSFFLCWVWCRFWKKILSLMKMFEPWLARLAELGQSRFSFLECESCTIVEFNQDFVLFTCLVEHQRSRLQKSYFPNCW